jgi:hypothetical protein
MHAMCGIWPGTCTNLGSWKLTARRPTGWIGTVASTSTKNTGRFVRSRAVKGSPEQRAERAHIARLRAREADRRKDWCEKTSTDLARRFDVIRFEDLQIKTMTRSARGHVGEPGPEYP